MNRNPFIPTLLLAACLLPFAGCRGGGTTAPGRTTSSRSSPSPWRRSSGRSTPTTPQLPTLWARHYYEVNLVDDKKKSHFVNGEGVLMYRRPMGMRLVGTKPLAGTVFELGSTEEKYWLKLVPEVDTMWYGDYANLGKPCVQSIPIQPNMVFEVLGRQHVQHRLHRRPGAGDAVQPGRRRLHVRLDRAGLRPAAVRGAEGNLVRSQDQAARAGACCSTPTGGWCCGRT